MLQLVIIYDFSAAGLFCLQVQADGWLPIALNPSPDVLWAPGRCHTAFPYVPRPATPPPPPPPLIRHLDAIYLCQHVCIMYTVISGHKSG